MNPRGSPLFKKQPISKRKASRFDWLYGADDRIRTGDLILTKDALYRLSYISASFDARLIILYPAPKCKGFDKIFVVKFVLRVRPRGACGEGG